MVAGRGFCTEDIAVVQRIVSGARGTSRFALAQAVCERLEWRRVNGKPKLRECRDLLEALEERGLLQLPEKRAGRPVGRRTSVPLTLFGEPQSLIAGTVADLLPLRLALIEDRAGHAYWRELIHRYHYLGFATPYGAYLRYVVHSAAGRTLGCLQYSSSAWRLAARDRWIGWSDTVRARGLGHVVQQSRFLILPWVRVPHLASHLLAVSTQRLVIDWQARFGRRPLLLETMVDGKRFSGTCYRAANWIEVGASTGRGRMDRTHERHGAAPKRVFVLALGSRALQRLRAA